MKTEMIAIELNPKTVDHIMAVAAFVWPALTIEELGELQADALVMYQTYYFIPQFIGKFSSPCECPLAVFMHEDVLKRDFDYEIIDPTKPFTIVRRKS